MGRLWAHMVSHLQATVPFCEIINGNTLLEHVEAAG